MKKKRVRGALLCGMAGCLCFGAGDWLMIYGDTASAGNLSWLTAGVARIAPWRNALAMALAFPGIVFYGVALLVIARLIKEEEQRRCYGILTVFSLTPWLCLHLFYIMILYAFAWLGKNGYEAAALPAAQALFDHLSWMVLLSEAMMLPPYLYWAFLVAAGRSALPRAMAISNPLVYYAVLKLAAGLMPDGAFQLAFTNGLMSESMAIWFASLIWADRFDRKRGSVIHS